MGWKLQNPFRKKVPHITGDDVAGTYGFGAPLQIHYKRRALPPVDNNGSNAYQTYLSPKWTPIGGGVPNKRDIGTAPPAYALQGALIQQVGSPGILAGAFVSGPLTNVSTVDSSQPIPNTTASSFSIPAP